MAMTIKNYGNQFQSGYIMFGRSHIGLPEYATTVIVKEKIQNNKYILQLALSDVPGDGAVDIFLIYVKARGVDVRDGSGIGGCVAVWDIKDIPTSDVIFEFIILVDFDDNGTKSVESYYGSYIMDFPRPMQFVFNFSLTHPNPNLLLNLNNDVKNEYDIVDSIYITNSQIVGFNVGDYKNVNLSTIPNDKPDTAQNKRDYKNFGNAFNRSLKYPNFFDLITDDVLDYGTYTKITILFDLIGITDFDIENFSNDMLDIQLTEDYSYNIENKTYYTQRRPYFKAIINSNPEDYPFENIRNKVIFDDEKNTSKIFVKQDETSGLLQTKISNIIEENTVSILFGSGVDWRYANRSISSEILLGVNRYNVENSILESGTLKKEFTERYAPACIEAVKVGTYTITLGFNDLGIETFSLYNLRFDDVQIGANREKLTNKDLENIGWT